MNARKAISPILATVILIAVTLVIAIGVIGWIMGIWGSFGTTESIQIYPDSKLTTSSIELHVKNTGSAPAVIYKVEIVGIGTGTVTTYRTVAGTITISTTEVTVGPGAEGTVTWVGFDGITPGAQYTIKVYTRAGNVYTINLVAQAG